MCCDGTSSRGHKTIFPRRCVFTVYVASLEAFRVSAEISKIKSKTKQITSLVVNFGTAPKKCIDFLGLSFYLHANFCTKVIDNEIQLVSF